MSTLEDALSRARDLDVDLIADTIEAFGFECTRCGACCTSDSTGVHVATVHPDEARELEEATNDEWRNVVKPVPYGLDENGEGETFEWALQTTSCGDCRFYSTNEEAIGQCTIYEHRPMICQTYPFGISILGATAPNAGIVAKEGDVVAYECEGLGREIDRSDAQALAETLKRRTIRDIEEMMLVRDRYRNEPGHESPTIIFDSEGAKLPDGKVIDN